MRLLYVILNVKMSSVKTSYNGYFSDLLMYAHRIKLKVTYTTTCELTCNIIVPESHRDHS